MKNKRLTAGFALCIVGACILLLASCYWALNIVSELTSVIPILGHTISILGYALVLIFLSVFARKSSRAEAIGILILSCVVPVFVLLTWISWLTASHLTVNATISETMILQTILLEVGIFLLSSVFNLIGGSLMLKAIPKTIVSAPEAEDEAETCEEIPAEQLEATEEESESAKETLPQGKTIKRRSGIMMRISRLLRAGKEKLMRFREKFIKKGEPKWKALVALTVIFVAISSVLILCFASGFFHEPLALSPNLLDRERYIGGLWFLIKTALPFASLSFMLSPIGAIIVLMLISMLPVYFVYLGMHNPLRLPRGYMFACNTFAATLFLLLDLRMIQLEIQMIDSLSLPIEADQIIFWTWVFVTSAIAAQIFSFLFLRYLVGEECSVVSSILFTVATELILPFVAAFTLVLFLVVFTIVIIALLAYCTICYSIWLLRNYFNNGGSPSKETVVINDGGQMVELTYNPHAIGDSRYDRVYEDYAGTRYISSDGGKTFRKQ